MSACNDKVTEQINPLVVVGDTPLRTSSALRLSRFTSSGTLAQPQPAVEAQGRNVILPGDFQGRAIAQPSQPTAVAHGRPGSISETKTDDNGVVGRGGDSAQKARSSRRPSAADTPRGTRMISFPRFLRAAENYHGTTAYVHTCNVVTVHVHTHTAPIIAAKLSYYSLGVYHPTTPHMRPDPSCVYCTGFFGRS